MGCLCGGVRIDGMCVCVDGLSVWRSASRWDVCVCGWDVCVEEYELMGCLCVWMGCLCGGVRVDGMSVCVDGISVWRSASRWDVCVEEAHLCITLRLCIDPISNYSIVSSPETRV